MKTLQTLFGRFCVAVAVALTALVLSNTARAAAADLDPTFNAAAYVQPSGTVTRTLRQPDGKIIVAGTFEVVAASVKDDIVRLNADGTVDETFNAPKIFQGITAVVLQPDGKILVAGNGSITIPGFLTPIARLNADGTLDNAFTPPFQFGGANAGTIFDVEILAGGKILIGGSFSYVLNNQTRVNIARLNADGSTDPTFLASNGYRLIYDLAVQADGKILGAITAGSGLNFFLKRLNADGTEDAAFTALTNGDVFTVKIQPDGKILIGGNFTAVNNFTARFVARLNADGSFDPTFASSVGADNVVRKIEIGGDGKILVGGNFTFINNSAKARVARLNGDGSVDQSFNPVNPTSPLETRIIIAYDLVPLPDGRIIVGGLGQRLAQGGVVKRLNADGTIDQAFNAPVGNRGTVTDFARQPDGKIVAAGVFNTIGSALVRQSVARFNADGTPDPTFTSPIQGSSSTDPFIRAVAVQPDGKILVGGQITNGIRRLNADGSFDTTFVTQTGSPLIFAVFDILLQPDGKIIAVGGSNVIRYNTNGTVDTTFQSVNSYNGAIYQAILQPDGKIVIGGEFTTAAGSVRNRVARLNADGTLDATFNPLGGANNYVAAVGRQSDGKIVIGGAFSNVNGTQKFYLARLNADGSYDASFTTTPNSTILGIKIQPDDKILIGGSFGTVNGVAGAGFRRLNADGSIDQTFDVGAGTNGAVYAFDIQPDNKILVGGNFTRYKNTPRLALFRLTNQTAPLRDRFDFDGDGRADVTIFRPSNGFWYVLQSAGNIFKAVQFGQNGDQIAPADYDGDGKTDIAVFRGSVPGAGNFAYFYILNSSDNSFRAVQFGATGDVPVSGDWDGDGKGDLAVYREGAQSNFYYRPSSQPTVNFNTIPLGTTGDKPLVADFDGDGRIDPAVFRPSNANWIILQSSVNQITQTTFGLGTDVPTPADYDGDGRANIAVFRPSTGTWFTSQNPATNFGAIQFGANGDLPVPADYDGDGRADVAVWRPSNGAWYLNRTSAGFTGVQFGQSGDKPAPNAFVR